MKHIYFSLLALFIMSTTLSAQSRNAEYTPTSEVPELILAKQQQLFPSNYVEGWEIVGTEENPELYMVKFQESSEKGFSATYTSDGTLVFHSKFLPKIDLPETPVLKIRSEYDRYTIQSGYRITIPVPKQEIYRIDILDGNRLQYLYYTANGEQIPEDALPLEIRLFQK